MPTSPLVQRYPPWGDFLDAQKVTKDAVKGRVFRLPLPLTNPTRNDQAQGGLRPPLLEVSPRGERADVGSAARRPPFGAQPPLAAALGAEIGPYGRIPIQRQARRARWTLSSYDTRPWSGSGCWGAGVCRFRAPGMNDKHPRQNRGLEKGCPPFLAFFWVLFLATQEKYKHPTGSRATAPGNRQQTS